MKGKMLIIIKLNKKKKSKIIVNKEFKFNLSNLIINKVIILKFFIFFI